MCQDNAEKTHLKDPCLEKAKVHADQLPQDPPKVLRKVLGTQKEKVWANQQVSPNQKGVLKATQKVQHHVPTMSGQGGV